MKTLLIGLLAFVIVLGASCKKENSKDVAGTEVKSELETKPNSAISSNYNPNIYPHVTGLCTCSDCSNYYWFMTNTPRHKAHCVCPQPSANGNNPPPPYYNGTQSGCNQPYSGDDVPILNDSIPPIAEEGN